MQNGDSLTIKVLNYIGDKWGVSIGDHVAVLHAGVENWALHDFLLLPCYLYLYCFKYAYLWYMWASSGMYPLAFVIVALITLFRTYARDHESAVNGTLTFVSIYHPHKSKFTLIKCLMFGAFAPIYGFWLMLTKGIAYLLMAYIMPYMLIRRMFNKNYLDLGPMPDTKERYRRTYNKDPSPSFWEKYVNK